jgi:hypothetical protein
MNITRTVGVTCRTLIYSSLVPHPNQAINGVENSNQSTAFQVEKFDSLIR